ncbi:MAG: hypothetical protein ACLSXO_04265 [Coprococcus sp.]
MLPSNLQLVSAEETDTQEKAEETAVLEDGINDLDSGKQVDSDTV